MQQILTVFVFAYELQVEEEVVAVNEKDAKVFVIIFNLVVCLVILVLKHFADAIVAKRDHAVQPHFLHKDQLFLFGHV